MTYLLLPGCHVQIWTILVVKSIRDYFRMGSCLLAVLKWGSIGSTWVGNRTKTAVTKFQDDNKIQIFNSLGIQFLFSIEKAGGNVISQNVISSCQDHKKRRGILIIIIIIIIILFIIIIITTITVCFDNPGARTTRGKQTLCSSLKRTRRTPSFAKFQRWVIIYRGFVFY